MAELDTEPDSAVFFHDYHLYLAPRLVRERRPETAMAHFVHIPWPQPDYWHVLPSPLRLAVHDGLLACDLIGFHTTRWRRNFLRSCVDLVGADCDFDEGTVEYEGRRVQVAARPSGRHAAELEELAASAAVLELEQQLVESRPEFMVLRVDRTDPSKNVVRGFRAFELFLDAHPELHGRVSMLALLDPSRQDIPEYAEYLGAIQRAARRVNDRFQQEGWTPIDLRIEDNFAEAVAAYKQFDVLLVNAIFDGLNLVAKEAPLVNERDGVLVLSENAGSHEELGAWALSVNPFDVEGQAEAIYAALTMPLEERRARLEAIGAHVRAHDVGGMAPMAARRPRPARAGPQLMGDLSHVDESGRVRMVDVGAKPQSKRRARARAEVRMQRETARRLRELPKGDALAAAQIAGIMAAKRTSDLIPLCHPLPLSVVEVELVVGEESVEITSLAETVAQTGVEMEALVAASVAALTVYDMAKGIDSGLVVGEVRLLEKTKEPA